MNKRRSENFVVHDAPISNGGYKRRSENVVIYDALMEGFRELVCPNDSKLVDQFGCRVVVLLFLITCADCVSCRTNKEICQRRSITNSWSMARVCTPCLSSSGELAPSMAGQKKTRNQWFLKAREQCLVYTMQSEIKYKIEHKSIE